MKWRAEIVLRAVAVPRLPVGQCYFRLRGATFTGIPPWWEHNARLGGCGTLESPLDRA